MQQPSRTAILYHFYEADPRYRENLCQFLALTLDLGHPIHVAASSALPRGLPDHPGLTVHEVPNHGYDFGGHAATLARLAPRLDDFDSFLFVNCSVRGPFLQQGQPRDWTRIFTDRLTGRVELVGATACDLRLDGDLGRMFQARHGRRDRLLHIQSTAYALSRAGLGRLIDAGFYDIPETYGKLDIIADFELRMTDIILRGGGGVECLMPIFAGVDFHAPDLAQFSTSDFGNLIGPEDYLGHQPDPWETLFTKVNLKDQDFVALAGRTWTNLNLNLAPGWRTWPPMVDLMRRCRAEAEHAAARHRAAETNRYWRRFMNLRRGLDRTWQRHLQG